MHVRGHFHGPVTLTPKANACTRCIGFCGTGQAWVQGLCCTVFATHASRVKQVELQQKTRLCDTCLLICTDFTDGSRREGASTTASHHVFMGRFHFRLLSHRSAAPPPTDTHHRHMQTQTETQMPHTHTHTHTHTEKTRTLTHILTHACIRLASWREEISLIPFVRALWKAGRVETCCSLLGCVNVNNVPFSECQRESVTLCHDSIAAPLRGVDPGSGSEA